MVAVQAAGVDAVDAPDGGRMRAVSLRDQLLAKWREEIRGLTPAERETWLCSVEGHAALGFVRCRELVRAIRRGRTIAARDICSGAWLDAHYEHGEPYPPGGAEVDEITDGRGSSMIYSSTRTSWGDGGDLATACTPATYRWLPAPAASTEDMLDSKTPAEGKAYRHPVSPSALAIFLTVTYGPKARRRQLGRTGVKRERAAIERARSENPRPPRRQHFHASG